MDKSMDLSYEQLSDSFLMSLTLLISDPSKNDDEQAQRVLELCAIVGGLYMQKKLNGKIDFDNDIVVLPATKKKVLI